MFRTCRASGVFIFLLRLKKIFFLIFFFSLCLERREICVSDQRSGDQRRTLERYQQKRKKKEKRKKREREREREKGREIKKKRNKTNLQFTKHKEIHRVGDRWKKNKTQRVSRISTCSVEERLAIADWVAD